ncbi:polysaccharide biosynthesis protein [Sphingomonas crusticola]|uniref:polysaccharide biosynthesis protein n=1 Tax=Sphingomonas crusticola TaxID=1697973 RepID=UPI001967A6E7|nr:nucleoside-diphosphate sugar epimerase/dehydratase [Sphingomonas crusticola]
MFVKSWAEAALAIPRPLKRAIALAVDAVLCLLSVWVAYYLRLGTWIDLSTDAKVPTIAAVVIALPIFVSTGLYRMIFRHAGTSAFLAILRASLLYGVAYATLFTLHGFSGVPRTVGLIQPLLLFLSVAGVRALAGLWLGRPYQKALRRDASSNVLIYGAGSSGRQLAGVVATSRQMHIVGFLDDDASLQGGHLLGLPVFSPGELETLIPKLSVSDIVVAMPSVTRRRRKEVLERLRSAGVAVRTLPGLMDLAEGKVHASDVKELEIEDLLGRDSVAGDEDHLRHLFTGAAVLVTGAGGSIGSELCRQILAGSPAMLLLVDSSEFALYAIHRELEDRMRPEDRCRIIPLLGSVTDRARMHEIIATWRPSTIYHAAAYKHVPLVEHNPVEGARNNVLGTLVMAQLAEQLGVARFVLVSTDKAVRPTNVMGATKRLAELILQALAADAGGTCYAIVRFGNVLGSSGSVVPLFRQQIRDGGPVTITHRDITRYFMTIPEAAQLVLQAGIMARGGEVFVLDMGEPVRVYDLARNMIELSGLSIRSADHPDGDIEIEVVGLRPGEKLFEELLIGNDPIRTAHPRIMMANEAYLSWDKLGDRLAQLGDVIAAQDAAAVRTLLRELVPEFAPVDDLSDWVAAAKEEKPARDRGEMRNVEPSREGEVARAAHAVAKQASARALP